MAILGQRHRDAAGAARQFENRAADLGNDVPVEVDIRLQLRVLRLVVAAPSIELVRHRLS